MLCWHYKSPCAKLFNLICLLLVANVGSHVQTDGEKYLNAETVCVTQDCLRTAEIIKSYLDESIDPCDNFYGFSCGNYIKNTIIPKGRGSINMFTDIEDLISEQLRPIISDSSKSNESIAIQLTKYFYASCVNQDESIEERTIKQIVELLENFGGWPVVKGDTWQPDNFDWIETVKQFRRLGLNTNAIFLLNIEIDSKNSSRRVLIVSHWFMQLFDCKQINF